MGHKAADFGDIKDLRNSAGYPMFKPITIIWSKPRIWNPGEDAPVQGEEPAPGYLYSLVRNHHKSNRRNVISYIGITNNLDVRFRNHPTAHILVNKKGDTALSVGRIDFKGYRTAEGSGNRRAIEELEHILVWAVGPECNLKKQYTLPGLGKNGGRAWHIENRGYRFSGSMPKEIIYPWMLIQPGRDRSWKKKPNEMGKPSE